MYIERVGRLVVKMMGLIFIFIAIGDGSNMITGLIATSTSQYGNVDLLYVMLYLVYFTFGIVFYTKPDNVYNMIVNGTGKPEETESSYDKKKYMKFQSVFVFIIGLVFCAISLKMIVVSGVHYMNIKGSMANHQDLIMMTILKTTGWALIGRMITLIIGVHTIVRRNSII